jgi:hypothetical protein
MGTGMETDNQIISETDGEMNGVFRDHQGELEIVFQCSRRESTLRRQRVEITRPEGDQNGLRWWTNYNDAKTRGLNRSSVELADDNRC